MIDLLVDNLYQDTIKLLDVMDNERDCIEHLKYNDKCSQTDCRFNEPDDNINCKLALLQRATILLK